MLNENYHTTDLGLTASLTASGFVVLKVDKSNPRRVVFSFEESPKLLQAVDQFWSHELKLPAAVLLEHIRVLKARIYA